MPLPRDVVLRAAHRRDLGECASLRLPWRRVRTMVGEPDSAFRALSPLLSSDDAIFGRIGPRRDRGRRARREPGLVLARPRRHWALSGAYASAELRAPGGHLRPMRALS